MGHGLLSIVAFKLKSPLSIGTRGESRGATQVNAITKQKSLCDATGIRASVTLFRYVALLRLYPCSITGAPELGYWFWAGIPLPYVRPFNSEVHSASALLPCFHAAAMNDRAAWLSGNRFEAYSSSSTYLDIIGRDFMTDGGGCQEEIAHCVSPK